MKNRPDGKDVSDTRRVVERWGNAVDALANLKRQISSAECELSNAANDLGKFLAPDDAVDGEIFNIWYGSKILCVQKIGQHDYKISWRKSQ